MLILGKSLSQMTINPYLYHSRGGIYTFLFFLEKVTLLHHTKSVPICLCLKWNHSISTASIQCSTGSLFPRFDDPRSCIISMLPMSTRFFISRVWCSLKCHCNWHCKFWKYVPRTGNTEYWEHRTSEHLTPGALNPGETEPHSPITTAVTVIQSQRVCTVY